MSQIPLRVRLRYIVGKRQVQRRFLLVTVISLILLFGDGTLLEIEETIPFEDFPIRLYVLKEDNSVDADSDVDSTANIGSNSSDYTNAQSLDGTYQTINESLYLPDYSGGGAGASFQILNQETGEIMDWRGQTYRHFYDVATGSYRFTTSEAVYKENTVEGTNWVLPDEYPNRFIIRLENESIYRFETPNELEIFFTQITNNTLWGVGVETYDGVLAFNLAIDNTYGHGQYMYYPRLKDGSLPDFNQPLYVIYDHLFARIGATTYDEILMNKSLYGAGQNPRNLLHFENTSDTMTVWFPINALTILGQDFDFRHGFKWNTTDELFHMITDFRCTTRGFDDIGMAYEIIVSPQAEGTNYQPEYFVITNGTNTHVANITQAWEAGTYLQDFYSKIGIVSENGNTFWFSFEDMEATFTQKYLDLHSQEIPARGSKMALRAGMYGYGAYTQNTWVEIDPTYSAKQTTDEYDFYVDWVAGPTYTVYTAASTMTVGLEKIGPNAAVHRGFVAFDTGITDRICGISNANMTVYIETELGEAGEYASLGLYFNESLVGGFWNESYADPNDQTVYDQTRYWTEASAFLTDQTGNVSISSSIVNTMLSNWVDNHNSDPANRQYIPLIIQNGTGQTSATDDQITLSESTTGTVSQRMTLEFVYVIPEILDITQFAKYKNITINSAYVTGNHSYFPVMIDIYDPDLRSTSRIQPDADDLAFRGSNGYELFYDLEYFDQDYNDTHAHLVAWVEVPSLVDYQDTEIQMFYGNPLMTAQEHPEYVWCNEYVGVYHLSEDPSGTVYDSTDNNLDGTSGGDMGFEDQIFGKIDGSLDFDGSNDYVGLTDNDLWTFNTAGQDQPLSFSAWLNFDAAGGVKTIAAKYDTTTNGEWNFQLDTNDKLTIVFTDSDGGTYIGRVYNTALTANNFYFVYAVYNGNETEAGIDLYVNGSLVDDTSYSFGGYDGMNNDAVAAIMGASNTGATGNFNGTLDEVRMQSTNRSANWILTEWNNQNDPSTFLTITWEATYRLSWEHQASSVDIHKDSYNLTVYGSFYSGIKPDTWGSWSSELMTNGGFESGDFTGWTEYTFQGDADWTAGTNPAFGDKGTQAGSYCAFIDENSNTGDYIRQDIDVSAYALYIDLGRAVVNATGWGVSAETGSDYFRIRTQALDKDSEVIGSDLSDTGYTLDATWTKYGAQNESLPVGTRYIRIWGYTYENGWDSGSVDSFSVKIRYKELPNSHPDEAYNFAYYKTLYVNNSAVVGSSALTNFTTLIELYDTALRNPVKVQVDGDDIAFGNDTVMFSHELELFDQDYNDTHAYLVAWVRIPTLYASVDTRVNMYYGNSSMSAQESPEDTWDSNYRGVWHLSENPLGLANSTYYYDEYSDSQEKWIDAPNSVDGSTATRAHTDYTSANTNVSHLFTGNTASAQTTTITNVYVRGYIDVYTTGKFYFTPVFSGNNGTERLIQNVYTDWSEWYKITNDPNMPSTWTWEDIEQLDVLIWASDPTDHDTSVYRLEIAVEHYGLMYDSTSYSNDGEPLNSPINDDTSKIDGGVSFDDSNERAVNISHDTSLQLVTNIYIQAWILTTDTETDVGLVVNKWGSSSSDRNYWLGKLNENFFAFYIDDTANVQYALSNFNDGEWHLVVCTANSTHIEMFLDGQSVADTTWDGTSVTGTADLHIGKATETSEQEFDGDIDEVRIATNGRGASWIETEWNSQNNPSSFFYSVSGEYALERVKVELWNTSSSTWIETDLYIEGEEKWYNYTVDTYVGVVSTSITWRYVDSWQAVCDLDKHTLEIDYAGIAYWNFSVNIIETTINFGEIANDTNWHEDPNKPVYINVSSGIAYDLEIRGSDGAYNPVSNEQIRFNTVDNPATGTNLTTSYQTLYNDQSAGETQLVVYLWVTGNYREYVGPYTFTLQIRIKKA